MDKSTIRSDRNLLVTALTEAGAEFKGSTSCLCPFHDDRSASGSIHADASGVWRFTCHGCKWGGDVFDVRANGGGRSVEAQMRELRQNLPSKSRLPHLPYRKPAGQKFATPKELVASTARIADIRSVDADYRYTNPKNDCVEMIVVRATHDSGKKTFRQGRPCSDGAGFEWGAPLGRWPLYNRTRVLKAHSVLVVEGEGCVHAAFESLPAGWAVTTGPGGAGKAGRCDWTPLSGKHVVLWPDNDPADLTRGGTRQGIDHMRGVADELQKLLAPPTVSWLDPVDLGLPEKGDVVDYIAEYGGDAVKTRDALDCALRLAQPISASRFHPHTSLEPAVRQFPLAA